MLKILVAEDDRNLARYYARLLSQWNCESVIEHTGTDAIRRAATFRPDVALLGVVIPEMGGVEAAIKLLEMCPGTKIVLVTESVPPETVKRLATRGYHFPTLPAPFAREELHAVVFGDAQDKALMWARLNRPSVGRTAEGNVEFEMHNARTDEQHRNDQTPHPEDSHTLSHQCLTIRL